MKQLTTLILILTTFLCFGQNIVTDKNGNQIKLNSDGTWEVVTPIQNAKQPTKVTSNEQTLPVECTTQVKFVNNVGYSLLMSMNRQNYTINVGETLEINVDPNTPYRYRVTTSDNSMWAEGPYQLNIYGSFTLNECKSKTITLNKPQNQENKMPDWKGW